MTRWSEKQYRRFANEIDSIADEINSKYGAKRTEVDGITFDSKKESERYRELKILERANEIYDLEIQPRFELQEGYEINGRRVRKIEYVADFSYRDAKTRELVVEDAKGHRTDVYKIKKKLFEHKYGIEILET